MTIADALPGQAERKPLTPGPPNRKLAWLPRMAQGRSRRRAGIWPLVGLVALTLLLGTWGFHRLALEHKLDFGQSFYHAFKLFALDLGPAGGGSAVGPNWQIVVAFSLAVLLVARAVIALAGNRLRRFAVRRLSGHVIVCGAGVHGSKLAGRLASEHDVVLIDIDAKAFGMRAALGDHEWRLVGDATQKSTLECAGVSRANQVAAITANEYVNSQIVSAIHALSPSFRDRLHLLVQVEDPSLARFLEEETPVEGKELPDDDLTRRSGSTSRPLPVVTPFSPNAIAAEELIDPDPKPPGEEPLLRMTNGKAPHLILAGDHPLIDAIVLAALRRWRVRILRHLEKHDKLRRPPMRISIYGPDAEERVESLRRQWMPEPSVLELDAQKSATTEREWEKQEKWFHERRSAGHAIVVCNEELEGIRLTLDISRALGDAVLITRVATERESALDERLEKRTAGTEVKLIAELGSDPDDLSIDARQRLVRVLEHDLEERAAEKTAAKLFVRPELRVHSDSNWRIRPSEHALVRALVAPVPVSALVRARLAVDFETPTNLRAAAEELSRQGESLDAFSAWCEYARQVTTSSPEHDRAGLDRATGHECADVLLRLRRGTLDASSIRDAPRGETVVSGKSRVAIFAGGAETMTQESRAAIEPLLARALDGYDGLVISGGTAVGLPEIVGKVARRLNLDAVGYTPAGLGERELYPTIRETRGATDFSVREPLAMWSDILSSGITVDNVRVVVCPGGSITRAEILLARALGARVGWLDPAGDADAPLDELLPLGADDVLELPADAMTLRAFLRWTTAPEELREPIARYIHSDYRRKHRGRKDPVDPALAPWDQLLPALQRSNLRQADDIPNKLAAVGRRLAKPGERLLLTDEEVELLAEIEHGRFNVERLTSGWQLGERNVSRLATPYLEPWDGLTDNVKEWDREAVRNIDPALASVGWGVANVGST